MRLFALLCVLAGCISDETGLHVVVHDQHTGATSVDMYIVVDEPDGIDAMAPLGAQTLMKGRVLLLDGSAPPTSYALHDGKVVFNILPTNAKDPLALPGVVFIGRDAQGGAVSFGKLEMPSLDAGGTAVYRVDLQEDASSVDHPSDDNRPSGVRIFEWNPPTGADGRTNCVDIEFAEDAVGGSVIHYFLVPPDDRDCDNVLATANVCPVENDYVYDPDRMTVPATLPLLENATCGFKSQVTIGVQSHDVCALGAPPPPLCSGPDPGDCLAFTGPKYCATQKICEEDACLEDPVMCATGGAQFKGWADESTGATFLRCTLAVGANGAACPATQGSSLLINFNTLFHTAFPAFPTASPVRCNDTNLWVPKEVPGKTARFYQTEAIRPKIAISPEPTSCNLNVAYVQDAVRDPGQPTQVYVYGGIDVTIGGGSSSLPDHIVMPMRVELTDCMQTPHCEIVAGLDDLPSLRQCIP